MKTVRKQHTHFWNMTLLFLLVSAAFGQAVLHGFVWDDHGLIVHNEYIKTVSSWSSLFINSFWQLGKNVEDQTRSFYRPIISLSYAAEYMLWGLNPRGYHLVNIIAHCICAWIVYALGITLFNDRAKALLAAGVFAILPIHVENVTWISGRTDVFCALFYLLAFTSYIRCSSKQSSGSIWFALFIVGYTLSLLSKEMALSFPILLVAYYLICQRKKIEWADFRPVLLLTILITIGYLYMRGDILGKISGAPQFGTTGERIASIPMVFVRYIALLTGLETIDPHHNTGLITNIVTFSYVFYVLISIAFVALTLIMCCKGMNRSAFFTVWIPLTLLPVFNFGTFGDIIYADRFLYIPSIGYAYILIIAATSTYSFLIQAPKKKLWKTVSYGVLVGYASIQIILANIHARYWSDDISLFSHATYTSPDSAYIHYNLGFSYARKGQHHSAVKSYAKAIELFPNYGRAYTNMGFSLKELGDYKKALAYLMTAIDLNNHSVLLYNNLGDTYRGLGLVDRAIPCYRLSLAIQANNASYNNLGECFLSLGDIEAAKKEFYAALEMKPTPQVYNNLGLCFLKKKLYEKSIDYLNMALTVSSESLNPAQELVIHANLARSWQGRGNSSQAANHAKRAITLLNEKTPSHLSPEILQLLNQLVVENSNGSAS
ncbi:MAG: tetratricopeptide repeat protein [Thermodesulfobacteriota bacterium]|nr:tetratricopeptide repeat protein [Thermodesulfobacteriota bacterium]